MESSRQVAALSYPHLTHTEIFQSVEEFCRRFYFRPRKIYAMVREMIGDRNALRRRLTEGARFLRFLSGHRQS